MNDNSLKFNRRISAFLSSPLFISEQWGLSQFFNYIEEVNLASDGQGEVLRNLWEQKKEAQKLRFLEVTEDHSKEVNLEQGLNSSNSIAVVQLLGTMRAEDGLSSKGIDQTCEEIKMAAASNARGIILRTSSGGGAVEAAQRLYTTLKEAGAKKPIVQFVDTLSASGAVFSGVASDSVVANGRTASLGSIGVVMQFPTWWVEAIESEVVSIYATQSKDKHDLVKDLIAKDYASIQANHLDPYADEFQRLVRKERPGVSDDALTGKMFIARDAKKMGLIDKIGGMNTAIREVVSLDRQRKRNSNARSALNMINF